MKSKRERNGRKAQYIHSFPSIEIPYGVWCNFVTYRHIIQVM